MFHSGRKLEISAQKEQEKSDLDDALSLTAECKRASILHLEDR